MYVSRSMKIYMYKKVKRRKEKQNRIKSKSQMLLQILSPLLNPILALVRDYELASSGLDDATVPPQLAFYVNVCLKVQKSFG